MTTIQYEPEQIDLRIFNLFEDDHFVDVEVLTKILHGLQKIVIDIAKDELNILPSGKIPKEKKQLFSVRCGIPRSGSYELSVVFGHNNSYSYESDLITTKVGEKIKQCFYSLGIEGEKNMFLLITNPILRKRVYSNFQTIIPPLGERWQLEISGKKYDRKIQLNNKAIQKLKQLQEDDKILTEEVTTLQVVTGHLVKMDFESRCITLKYPPTQTKLKCYYTDKIEMELFQNRRELLQITGNITYGEQNREIPKKITDVNNIQFLDLSDFLLTSFPYKGGQLIFKKPLTLSPKLTESCQFMTLQYPKLGIDVIAQTRKELEEELSAEIETQWEYCAKQPDEKLGKEFIKQKNNLLASIEEKISTKIETQLEHCAKQPDEERKQEYNKQEIYLHTNNEE
ncbi:MAG: hypothetical protein LBP59_03685 [Planctomycetaceae bacterium]|jgi:hypothetical protein|nr:hypothetical protein [Planctomycetaceae bacterium]